jgi:hypothetical protein
MPNIAAQFSRLHAFLFKENHAEQGQKLVTLFQDSGTVFVGLVWALYGNGTIYITLYSCASYTG